MVPSAFDWPSAETIQCPYQFYSSLREAGPYRPRGEDYFQVSRWEDVAYVLEHPELFRQVPASAINRGGPAEGERYSAIGMSTSDPPEHQAKRALGLRLVARDRLRRYVPMIRGMVDGLIDGFVGRGEVELHSEFADPLPRLVIARILGLPDADLERFAVWAKRDVTPLSFLPEHVDRFLDEGQLAAQAAQEGEASQYLRDAILERVESPRGDFLSELIAAQVERDGELSLGYLTAEAGTLLYAGNITTSHMIVNAMTLLLRHPDELECVVADRARIRLLLEEALRLESPLQWVPRVATVDVELGGARIPEGARVFVMFAAANRDEERFPHADEFEPDRPDLVKHHVAFGRGIHFCLGAPLARLEGRIAFERLLDRLHNLRLVCARPYRHSLAFRAPTAVELRFDPA